MSVWFLAGLHKTEMKANMGIVKLSLQKNADVWFPKRPGDGRAGCLYEDRDLVRGTDHLPAGIPPPGVMALTGRATRAARCACATQQGT